MMKTVSDFEHQGRKVQIRKFMRIGRRLSDYTYRAWIDGHELVVNWPCARSLELAVKKLIDEENS